MLAPSFQMVLGGYHAWQSSQDDPIPTVLSYMSVSYWNCVQNNWAQEISVLKRRKNQNVNLKTIKFPKETGKNLYDLGLVRHFLGHQKQNQ